MNRQNARNMAQGSYYISIEKLDLGVPADQARWVKVRRWDDGMVEYWTGTEWVESPEQATPISGLQQAVHSLLAPE